MSTVYRLYESTHACLHLLTDFVCAFWMAKAQPNTAHHSFNRHAFSFCCRLCVCACVSGFFPQMFLSQIMYLTAIMQFLFASTLSIISFVSDFWWNAFNRDTFAQLHTKCEPNAYRMSWKFKLIFWNYDFEVINRYADDANVTINQSNQTCIFLSVFFFLLYLTWRRYFVKRYEYYLVLAIFLFFLFSSRRNLC